ncbi:MAG: DUF6962 family protein [Pseudomonadota bacterium]
MSGSLPNEPMTVFTDYLIVAECLWLSIALWRSNRERHTSRRLWAWALLLSALAAFTGGTMHGFRGVLPDELTKALWMATLFTSGLVAFCFAQGTAKAVLPAQWHRAAAVLFGLKLALYSAWIAVHDAFIFVIADYGSAMLVVLLLQGYAWWRRPSGNEKFFVIGIAVSVLAAAVQASGFSLHEHFNYNDLYHVIQMVGLYFLYRGARELTDRTGDTRPERQETDYSTP